MAAIIEHDRAGSCTSLLDVCKHWAVYGLGSVLSRVAGLLMIPVYTRYLSPADYGIREMVVVSVNIVTVFLALGIRGAIFRFYYEDGCGKARPEAVGTGLVLSGGLSIAGVGVALWSSGPLSSLMFGEEGYAYFLRLGLINLLFASILEVPLGYIQVRKRSALFTLISVAQFVLGVSMNLFFLIVLQIGVVGLFYTEIVTSGLLCVILVWFALDRTGWSFSSSMLWSMIRYGAPGVIGTFGWLIINGADRIILARHASLSEVGIYSLANQFGQILLIMLVYPFQNVWGPAQFEIDRRPNGDEQFQAVFQLFTSVLLLCGFTLAIFVEDVVKIAVPGPFWAAASLVPGVALSNVLMGVHLVFSAGILIRKRTEYVSFIILSVAGLSVLVNLMLVPVYLSAGAVTTRVASLVAVVGMTYWMSQRLHPIDYRVPGVLKNFGCVLGLFILSRSIPAEPYVLSVLSKLGLIGSFLGIIWMPRYGRRVMQIRTEKEKLVALGRAKGVGLFPGREMERSDTEIGRT